MEHAIQIMDSEVQHSNETVVDDRGSVLKDTV